MKVVFDPIRTNENQYSGIIKKQLELNGIEVYSLDSFLSDKNLSKAIKIVHLNWFENLFGGAKTSKLKIFVKKCIILIKLKLSGKKIIWTMHNKVNHDKDHKTLKKILLYLLYSFSDKIIIHSHVSNEIIASKNPSWNKKVIHIPHPNYIDVYGPPPLLSSLQNTPKLNLLFLGTVKPYKNIELLIDAVKQLDPNDVTLTIAGKPFQKQYTDVLQYKAEAFDNIRFELKFIADDEIPRYLAACDLLVLPYDLRSSLNSGAVILAFSYGRTVICPRIGTISDIEDEENLFTYEYSNNETHLRKMVLNVRKAIQLKRENNAIFLSMGQKMKDVMKQNNDKEMVGQRLAAMYNQLMYTK